MNKYLQLTNFNILKFIFGSEAWGTKTKETYYSLLSLKMTSLFCFILIAKYEF